MRRGNRLPSPPSTVGSRSSNSSLRSSSSNNVVDSSDSETESLNKPMAGSLGPSRPLSVAMAPGSVVQDSFCFRKPRLSDVLSNTAPAPWTLSAFMAYLSHNHCLETLEFTLDASRYGKHYDNMLSQAGGPRSEEARHYVKMLWQRLLQAYIVPNGPREVNLPANVRDTLLAYANPAVPPTPSTLDDAVKKIYELMEESVLGPFLNSLYPVVHLEPALAKAQQMEEIMSTARWPLTGDQQLGIGQDQSRDRSPHPDPSSLRHVSGSSSPASFQYYSRHDQSLGQTSQPIAPAVAGSPGSQSLGSAEVFMDDPASLWGLHGLSDPMTPPSTPPTGDFSAPYLGAPPESSYSGISSNSKDGRDRSSHFNGYALSTSGAGGANHANGTWKKMSSKLGWRKRTGQQLRNEVSLA